MSIGAIGSVAPNLTQTEGVTEIGRVILLHPKALNSFLTGWMKDPFSGLYERGHIHLLLYNVTDPDVNLKKSQPY